MSPVRRSAPKRAVVGRGRRDLDDAAAARGRVLARARRSPAHEPFGPWNEPPASPKVHRSVRPDARADTADGSATTSPSDRSSRGDFVELASHPHPHLPYPSRPPRPPRRRHPRARTHAGLALVLALVAVLGSAACATPPPQRQPPDFAKRFESVRTITLVPPKVAIYEMSAGSTEEEVQAWSDEAQAHVVEAVKSEVAELGRTWVPFAGEQPHADVRVGTARERAAAGAAVRTPAEDSWLLFEAANLAIMRHAYDPWQTFPASVKSFDYTLGEEAASLLGGTEADAFMLVVAVDHVPTRHRQALVAMGLGMAAMTGSYAGPGATPAKLTLALVETKTGDILWFNTLSLPFTDLRDEATDEKLVETVMKGLAR